MKKIIYILFLAVIIISCQSKSDKQKGTTNDSIVIQPVPIDSSTMGPKTLTRKLIYKGYEEGDYAHLMFKDSETGEDYDFGHPTENVLGGTGVVLADSSASFGFKQNGKELGNSFTVTMEKKMVNTYDGNGQPIKAEDWRITSISR